jgi:hypothetical protein
MMAARKKPSPEPENAYTLREEQQTMLGLPTKAPEKVPEEVLLARLLPDEVRLQRVVEKYKPRPAPAGQMGFGAAFGAVTDANQLDLFGGAPPALPSKSRSKPPREGR